MNKKQLINSLCQEYRQCTKCPLGGKNNWAWPRGNVDSRWMICGEGPGKQEVLHRRFFVGPAGQLMDKEFQAQGLNTNDFFVTNVSCCRAAAPYGSGRQNLTPNKEHVVACKWVILNEIEIINPSLIIAVGKTATCSLLDLPNIRMGDVVNLPIMKGSRCFLPMYHPASVLHADENRAEQLLNSIRESIGLIKKRTMEKENG